MRQPVGTERKAKLRIIQDAWIPRSDSIRFHQLRANASISPWQGVPQNRAIAARGGHDQQGEWEGKAKGSHRSDRFCCAGWSNCIPAVVADDM